ncbi:MAG: PspC domain-containing protein [Bacteroidales bacterium]|nr:PspC domain-containing protein [Bacteroidales bacterium]MBQ1656303.1 PspC domain-containing protein [Bacteroidales bacterium]MBQ1682846.1 PspC domain-containing protein [Bacteroidales bacterium]MBQ1718999.1 PspC domain-containing protein [Bacteroidales bacterium]MBQ2107627.1 PspC domain-containing protein [Bacteroidales bacterium]
MKKVINAGIGGRSFTVDEDAYARLDSYLVLFKSRLSSESSDEVMSDLESRIAELFAAEVGAGQRVVNLDIVERVISQLGMPDGSPVPGSEPADNTEKRARKLYRDVSDRRIAGVCAGLAAYFEVDVVLVRIIMLVALVAGSIGFWLYVILWIAVPKATTAAEQCELRGLAPTAENLAKYSNSK